MSRTEQKFLTLVKEYNLIEPGDKILIALSGGPDSVFLLHLLIKYKSKFKIEIAAAHLNHSLRGKDADEDENFCSELSRRLNIQYFSKKVDIKKLAVKFKLSIEEMARNERYSFLKEISETYGCNKIATAHNLNDNSETVLLNLIKGAGLRGVSGIPLTRGIIIRPVLNIPKHEILEYLNKKKITFCKDITNESDLYERNFIRNKLLPLIRETLNPAVDKSIFNSSRIFKNELEIIDEYLQSITEEVVKYEKEMLVFDLAALSKYSDAVIGELLKVNLKSRFNHEIEFNDFRKVKELLTKQTGKRIILSGKLFAYKERGRIYINRSEENVSDREGIEVKVNKLCSFNNAEIRITSRRGIENFKSDKFHEIITADELDESFLLRKWKNGDKFIPLGMKNFKKVSDFLTEQKIPSYKKKKQLVLINKEKIVWIPGFRIDERVKLTKDTKRIYELWMNPKS